MMTPAIGSYEWYHKHWFDALNWRRTYRGTLQFFGEDGRHPHTCSVFPRLETGDWNYVLHIKGTNFGPGAYPNAEDARKAAFDHAMSIVRLT